MCVCVRVSACVCVGYMIHMIICIYIYVMNYIYICVYVYYDLYIYIYLILYNTTRDIYIYICHSGATWGPMKPHSCQENMRQAIQRPMGSRASEVRSHPKSRQIDKRKYAYGMH